MFNFCFGLIQLIIIIGICLYETNKKSSACFMWGTLLLMYGVMNFLTTITDVSQYDDYVILKSSIFVIFFSIIYIISRLLFSKLFNLRNDLQFLDLPNNNNSRKSKVYLIILLFTCFIMIWNLASFSGGLLNTSWGEGREYTRSLGYINSYQILNIIYFLLGGLPLYFMLNKQKKLGILCFLVMLLLTIFTRNRILVLPILVSLILYQLIKIYRINFKHIIAASFFAVFIIYLVYGLRVFRHYGSISVFLDEFNMYYFIDRINTYIVTGNGELGLRNDFYYFILNDNLFKGFGECASYIRMLLVYVPTSFSCGLKPEDFAITMGQAIGMAAGGSTHPTLFGDCYANLGNFGVLLGIFWAFYACCADKIIAQCKSALIKVLLYSLFSTTFVIMARGSVYNPFFFVAWGIPLLYLSDFFIRKLVRIRIKSS